MEILLEVSVNTINLKAYINFSRKRRACSRITEAKPADSIKTLGLMAMGVPFMTIKLRDMLHGDANSFAYQRLKSLTHNP